MKCNEVSCLVVGLVLKRLRDECEQLCSRSRKGMLRKSSPDDLQSFNWVSIASELKQEAPLLFAVLTAAGAPPRPRNVSKGATEESRYPAICTAAAVLLKERCDFMSALQHLLGIILFHGNASKQVSKVQDQCVHMDTVLKLKLHSYRPKDVLLTSNSASPPLRR